MLHTKIATVVAAFVVTATSFAAGPASAAVAHPRSGGSAHPDSVTGCLRKGDKPNSFTVTGSDGKTVTVKSQTVSLAGHVGHTVTLFGKAMPAGRDKMGGKKASEMSRMGDSSKMHAMNDSTMPAGAGMKHGMMRVTRMTMVSATCQ